MKDWEIYTSGDLYSILGKAMMKCYAMHLRKYDSGIFYAVLVMQKANLLNNVYGHILASTKIYIDIYIYSVTLK